MAAARLTDVVTVWPAQDNYAVHSGDVAGKRTFQLFNPRSPVPHEFYLAHDTVLSFSGSSRIDIEFQLSPAANVPILAKWDFWDGQTWRPFTDINPFDPTSGSDGTLGFTRSGIISLRAGCGQSQPTTILGMKRTGFALVSSPSAPSAGRVLAMVDRVRLRSVIAVADVAAFPPDAAFADATKLDTSKVFYPFDQQPHTRFRILFQRRSRIRQARSCGHHLGQQGEHRNRKQSFTGQQPYRAYARARVLERFRVERYRPRQPHPLRLVPFRMVIPVHSSIRHRHHYREQPGCVVDAPSHPSQ